MTLEQRITAVIQAIAADIKTLLARATGGTIGGAVSGGSTTRVLYQSGSNLAQSGNLTFDGTTFRTTRLYMGGEPAQAAKIAVTGGASALTLAQLSGNANFYIARPTVGLYNGFWLQGAVASDMYFGSAPSSDDIIISTANQSQTERFRFGQNGSFKQTSLAGSGSRLVQVDSTGVYSASAAVPPVIVSAYKTADTTRANTTTLSADPHLSITLAAGGVYHVTGMLAFTPGGGDIKLDLRGGTATLAGYAGSFVTNDAINGFASMDIGVLLASSLIADAGTITFDLTVEATTAGNFAVRFAQDTSNADGAVMKKYSAIKAVKLN